MSKPNQPPAAYFHRPGKTQPQDRFQRQDGPAVRARSKAAYKANPTLAKFMGALWAEKHREERRESVRRYRAANLDKVNAGKRRSWKRTRTEEKLEKKRVYSREWRARKKRGSVEAP